MLYSLSENDGVVTPMSLRFCGVALPSNTVQHYPGPQNLKTLRHPEGLWAAFKVFLPFHQRTMHVQSRVAVIFHPAEFLKSNSLPSFCPIFSVYFSPSWQCFCHILHTFYSSTLVQNTKLCISLLRLL